MNIFYSAASPLPACLHSPVECVDQRRNMIGTHRLTPVALDRFNRLLERVGSPDLVMDGDRLVTAARALRTSGALRGWPECIRLRLARARAAVSMVRDPQWGASEEAIETVRHVAEYVAADDDLIPDTLPTVGRLDDAIVVEAAWPVLSGEITDYVDFRRLRRLALEDRSQWSRFDRDAWRQAQAEEVALIRHQMAVRDTHYWSSGYSTFHVC